MGRGVGCAVEGLPMGAGKKEGQGVRGEVVGAAAALNRSDKNAVRYPEKRKVGCYQHKKYRNVEINIKDKTNNDN